MSLLLPFPIRFPLYYSVGDDQIFLQSPSDIVDLGSDAVDTAHLLGRLSRFLRGARNLLTCYFLSPREFRRNSRKVGHLVFSPAAVALFADGNPITSCGR
jgi:hypothetical protein